MTGSDITKTETKHDGSNVKPVVIAYFVVCSLVLCILVFYACRKFGYAICWDLMHHDVAKGKREKPKEIVEFEDKSYWGVKMPVPFVMQNMLDEKFPNSTHEEKSLPIVKETTKGNKEDASNEPDMIVTVINTPDATREDAIPVPMHFDDNIVYTTNRIELR